MEQPYSVSPVADTQDSVRFEYSFGVEGKAVEDYLTELDNGDLLIDGFAAEFSGEDRQGENFIDGAFQRGIKAFMENGSPLCYHHKTDKCLGKVLELEEVPGRGLHMVARIDGAIQNHPELGTYYNQIKKGTYNSLSCGGYFKRKMTPKGPRISECDFTEISVTPVACHTKPSFSVVAGKALEMDDEEFSEGEVEGLSEALERLDAALGAKAVEPKGEYSDLYCLALILELEQQSRNMPLSDEDGDKRVDALVTKAREALSEVAREAHSIAAKLGPLPKISYSGV